jgi:hypothetical protein
MNYITRTVGNTTLYYDGEKFQPEKVQAQSYEAEDARSTIESNDLQFAEITPIVYDGTGWMLN